MLDDDELPLLSRVVRGGDAEVIRTARRSLLGLGLPVHIDTGAPLTVVDGGGEGREPDPLDETLALDGRRPGPRRATVRARPPAEAVRPALEALVDALLERHVAALRRDLRTLLADALDDDAARADADRAIASGARVTRVDRRGTARAGERRRGEGRASRAAGARVDSLAREIRLEADTGT